MSGEDQHKRKMVASLSVAAALLVLLAVRVYLDRGPQTAIVVTIVAVLMTVALYFFLSKRQ